MSAEAIPDAVCAPPVTRLPAAEASVRAIFVRHGQSTGNVGVPAEDLALIELTDVGRAQAQAVADGWSERPDLIVTSPYLRARDTAARTIDRFPDTPVEVWPIQEFTYLQPSRWNGSASAERRPFLLRYWQDGDPAYCDGEDAESFSTLLRRAEAALQRLAALPRPALVYLFAHGQFIQAARAVVTQGELNDAGKMRRFRDRDEPRVANAEHVAFLAQGGEWIHASLGPEEVARRPPLPSSPV